MLVLVPLMLMLILVLAPLVLMQLELVFQFDPKWILDHPPVGVDDGRESESCAISGTLMVPPALVFLVLAFAGNALSADHIDPPLAAEVAFPVSASLVAVVFYFYARLPPSCPRSRRSHRDQRSQLSQYKHMDLSY
jgi:hypothetical protein